MKEMSLPEGPIPLDIIAPARISLILLPQPPNNSGRDRGCEERLEKGGACEESLKKRNVFLRFGCSCIMFGKCELTLFFLLAGVFPTGFSLQRF